MADYYLEFSQVLSHLTDDELDWLGQQLEIVHVFGDQEFTATNVPSDLDRGQADWSGYRFYRDFEEDVPDREDAGFCFQLNEREASDFGQHLWAYAQE